MKSSWRITPLLNQFDINGSVALVCSGLPCSFLGAHTLLRSFGEKKNHRSHLVVLKCCDFPLLGSAFGWACLLLDQC